MNKGMFFSKMDRVISQSRLFKFVIVCLSFVVIIGSYYIYIAVRHHTIIVMPSVITDKIEFIGGKPSDRYLTDIARQTVDLGFNYSPATARDRFNDLLRLFSPESYLEASHVWYDLADRIEETGVSNVFYTKEIKIEDGVIRIKGDNIRMSRDYEVEKADRVYIIGYEIKNGRFGLRYIKEKA